MIETNLTSAPSKSIGRRARRLAAHPAPQSRQAPRGLELPALAPNFYARATLAFLFLGLFLRIARYALRFPFWGDEILLSANFLDRGFFELARPLDNHQVAPVAFLWIEHAATLLLGFSELSLRLFPLLCGLAAMFLFYRTATRHFAPQAALWGVAIFAVSSYIIRPAAEVKPYAGDCLASIALLTLWFEWQQARAARWLWALACAAPLCVAFSYPAVFLVGGISLALLPALVGNRERREWLPWLLMNALAALVFLVVLRLSAGPQFAAEQAVMTDYWAGAFPPLARPWELPRWFLLAHTGEMFAYPLGAENGGSTLTFVLFVVGMWALWRGRQRPVALLTLAIFGLAFVAAALGRYPYGGHPRLVQYVAPLICLVAGVGIMTTLDAFGHPRLRRATIGLIVFVCAGIGVGIFARDATHPYRDRHELIFRDMARQFWGRQNERDGTLLCVSTDLGIDLYPGDSHELAWLAYRCNQRVYSRRHRNGPQRVNLTSLPADQPLRCVVYHQASDQRDDARRRQWLDSLAARYELQTVKTYRQVEPNPRSAEMYDLYEFAPRPPDNGD